MSHPPIIFCPLRVYEFLQDCALEIRWVWDLFIPEGALVLLNAFMKVGKSTFIYALAIAVAQGRPFLGYPTRQGGVLILALEEHVRDVGRRLNSFGVQPGDPIWIIPAPLTNSRPTLEALRGFILEQDIKLVIIDTLTRFWDLADENSNSEIVRQVSPLLDLAHESGVSIILVHHERKAGGEEGRGIRGGSALFGLVDQSLHLDRRHGGGDTDRVLKAIGRYPETPRELYIALAGTDYHVIGTADDLDPDSVDERVLQVLAAGRYTRQALQDALKLSYKVITASLIRLDSKITREGTGHRGDPFTYGLLGKTYEAAVRAPSCR